MINYKEIKTDSNTPLVDLISFNNKTVLVTGAAAGMGLAIAKRFGEAGANLLLIDVNANELEALRQQLNPEKTQTFVFDLSSKTAIDQFWSNLIDNQLPDILINNAGIFPFKDFLEVDEAYLKHVMDTNFQAIFWMCQHFIRRCLKQGGVIVNTSSIEAMLPFKSDLAHYASSKAAVLSLTRSLARDYGRHNFRVNSVMPGGIKTPGTTKLAKQALFKLSFSLLKTGVEFNQRLPLGRFGQADEVARAVVFLASDLSSYINGVYLPVDGGFLSA
mgnify:FL=1